MGPTLASILAVENGRGGTIARHRYGPEPTETGALLMDAQLRAASR